MLHTPLQCTNPNEVHLQQQSNIQMIEIQSKIPNKPHQKLQANQITHTS